MLNQWVGPIIFIALSVVPLLLGIGYALLYSLGLTGIINNGFTLAHWHTLLQDASFWETIGFSLVVALSTMVISIALALGLVLREPTRFQRPIPSFLMYMPLAIPAIVMAFFIFQMFAKGGWLSRIAFQLKIIPELQSFPDLINDNLGIGIIVSHTLMAVPFFVLFFTNIYQNEDIDAYRKLAFTMGTSRKMSLWYVQLPMLLRPAQPTLFLYFLFVMGSYEIPLLLGSQSKQMIAVLTIQKMQRYNLADIPQAYAISVAYTVVVILLLYIMVWVSQKNRSYDP